MIDKGKRSVLGVGVSVIDYDAVVSRIVSAAREQQPLGVAALAVHGVMTGALDRFHKYRLNRLEIITPDGQPVRWALRFLYGERLPDRVYGPELVTRTCEAAARNGLSVFFYGSRIETLKALTEHVSGRHPHLRIVGAEASKFRNLSLVEDEDLDRRIAESGADIVFVGLGCPRQEVFVYEHSQKVQRPLVAVGAAFDFHSGQLRQAPGWMQDRGLEWLFRLMEEPKRLWRRYLYLNPLYCSLILLQLLRLSKRQMAEEAEPRESLRYG